MSSPLTDQEIDKVRALINPAPSPPDPPPVPTVPMYSVVSTLGEVVCGPFMDQTTADGECLRLKGEAVDIKAAVPPREYNVEQVQVPEDQA